MSLLSPEPSQLVRSSRRCEGAAMNWKYKQTHPNSSLLNSQRCEGCPTISLDWEMSVYMNTRNIRSDTSPPSAPPTPHSSACELSDHRHPLPPGLKHAGIQRHKHTIQVSWMLHVKNANQTDPSKEQRGSLFDLGVSDVKHTHAHTSEAIQSQFVECVIVQEQRRREKRWLQTTTTTPLTPFFCDRSFFCLHIWTALLPSSLWHPPYHNMMVSRVWLSTVWKYSRHGDLGLNEWHERLSYESTHRLCVYSNCTS